tara:strand:+ start:463 stop:753 length:291 start_codon:yes stop_codon:yes gene_type:complete
MVNAIAFPSEIVGKEDILAALPTNEEAVNIPDIFTDVPECLDVVTIPVEKSAFPLMVNVPPVTDAPIETVTGPAGSYASIESTEILEFGTVISLRD